jgi:hypothetical protein
MNFCAMSGALSMQTKRGRVLQFGLLYGLIASGPLTLSYHM